LTVCLISAVSKYMPIQIPLSWKTGKMVEQRRTNTPCKI